MTKGLLIGLLVGAALGAILGTMWGRSRRDPPPVSDAQGPGETAAEPRNAANETLRSELDLARSQIESLKLELETARKAAAPAVAPEKAKRTWSALQARIAAALKSGRLRSEDDPVTRDLQIDAFALLQDLAKEKGVTLSEALTHPEGWPALVAAFLESAEPPLTAEERILLENALADCRRDWDAFAARREQLTGLEIIKEAERLADSFDDALKPALKKTHEQPVDDLEELVEDVHPSRVLDFKDTYEASDEEVRRQWGSQWGEVLMLRADQKSKLGPILDEYLRDQDAMETEAAAAEAAQRDWDRTGFRNRKIDLMNGVQRRILERLDLDAAQTAALRSWAIVYVRERP